MGLKCLLLRNNLKCIYTPFVFYQLSVNEFYVKCYVHWKLIQSRWWTGDTPFVLLKGRTPDFHLSLNWIRCGLSQCAVKSWIPTSFVTSSPSFWNGGEFPTLVMKLTDVVWSFCWTLKRQVFHLLINFLLAKVISSFNLSSVQDNYDDQIWIEL